MDINQHERLSNLTLRHTLKKRNDAFIAYCFNHFYLYVVWSLLFCIVFLFSWSLYCLSFSWLLYCLSFSWPLYCLSFSWPLYCLSFSWSLYCLSFSKPLYCLSFSWSLYCLSFFYSTVTRTKDINTMVSFIQRSLELRIYKEWSLLLNSH